MIIALNTSSPATQIVLVDTDGIECARKDWEAGRELSSQLLDAIHQLLIAHRLSWDSLTGVVVFRGPGSFTGLRIGVTVANAIAYAQSIPVAGVIGEKWLAQGVQDLARGKGSIQTQPEYGAPPRITRPGGNPSAQP
jgi:tRNA threonylcarbamoyladenosine biosynthesis protein TsaB